MEIGKDWISAEYAKAPSWGDCEVAAERGEPGNWGSAVRHRDGSTPGIENTSRHLRRKLQTECGWKHGDRGSRLERKESTARKKREKKKKRKTHLAHTGVLMGGTEFAAKTGDWTDVWSTGLWVLQIDRRTSIRVRWRNPRSKQAHSLLDNPAL